MGVSIFIIVVFSAGALSCPIAQAADRPDFGLQPVLYDPANPVTRSYFVFDSSAGMILHNRVRVTNSGTTTGTVHLYPVDATTGQTSGVVYLSGNDPQREVGTWITLGLQHVTLMPGQSQIVPFQVAIPSIARSGQHVGGIVAESQAPGGRGTPGTGPIQINVQSLTIVAVQINLPGTPVEQLVASAIQPGDENGYQNLLVHLSNTGTEMLKPEGELEVSSAEGKVIRKLPLKLDTILPQTAINYPVYVEGQALKAGTYRAALMLQYGRNHVLHFTQAFTITQHQLRQVFTSSSFTMWGDLLSAIPLWQIVVGGLLVASGLFFWTQKLYQCAMIPRRLASSRSKRAK